MHIDDSERKVTPGTARKVFLKKKKKTHTHNTINTSRATIENFSFEKNRSHAVLLR